MQHRRKIHPLLKIALELGPLALFFFANARWGIFVGTGVLMAAVLISLPISYTLTGRLPMMAIVSAVIGTVFGALTLYLHDETFIKTKPTIVNGLFAAVLLGGLAIGRPPLALVFDEMFRLTPEGWRKLTLRWGLFFAAMAVLNEVIWRTQSTDVWVSFKAFGFVPLTFLFAMAQYPLLMRYAENPEKEASAQPGSG